MTQPEILQTLVRKRADLLLDLRRAEAIAHALRDDLEHIDGAVRVFAPEIALRLLGVLRVAGRALSVDEVAAEAKMAPGQAGALLRHMRNCGLARSEGGRWYAAY